MDSVGAQSMMITSLCLKLLVISRARTLGSGFKELIKLSEKSNLEGIICRPVSISTTTSEILRGLGEGVFFVGGRYSVNISTTEGDLLSRNRLYRYSPMRAWERFACGSRSIAKVLREVYRDAYRLSNAATVVLPTPPFMLITETQIGPFFLAIHSPRHLHLTLW